MNKRKITAAAVILLILAAAAFHFLFPFLRDGRFAKAEHFLVLRDGHTDKEITRYPFSPDDRFSIEFIHSVNKSPVIDVYEVREGHIFVVETVYYHFGAGVPTELNEGETLTYGEDGSMIISGIDKSVDPLYYIVGTVSDHTLSIGGSSISLRNLCGKNRLVKFCYE